jgi:hypothetical protein
MFMEDLEQVLKAQTSFFRANSVAIREAGTDLGKLEPIIRSHLEEQGFRFYLQYNPLYSRVSMEVNYRGEFIDIHTDTEAFSKQQIIEIYISCLNYLQEL